MTVKKLSLQLLSRSFKKCADSYPETDMYLDASKELSEYFFNIFSLNESFLTRKPYCIQIVKKYFRYGDFFFGCFDVPTLMLISIENIFNEKIYDIIVLSKGEIFASSFERGVMRIQENIVKYMESQNCDDFRRIEVLKSLCFYGRSFQGVGDRSKTKSRGSYYRLPSSINLSNISQIEDLWFEVCGYIGYDDAHAKFNASDDISLMIRRKRGRIKLKRTYDDTRIREAKRTKTIADNFRNMGGQEQEKVAWDRLSRLLHLFYREHVNDQKEVQDIISSCWSLTKDKICVALFMEGLPCTTTGILNLHERYLNNITATIIFSREQVEDNN